MIHQPLSPNGVHPKISSFLRLLVLYLIILIGHVLRRLDLSNMTHHRPLVRRKYYALISSAQWRNKWQLSFTFGLVLLNDWCIGYMQADDGCMNRRGRVLLNYRLFKFEFRNNGCCVGKQTGIVEGIIFFFFSFIVVIIICHSLP